MKPITNKATLPKPWYCSGPAPEEQLQGLSIYQQTVPRTMDDCEQVLVAAGFTAEQVAALKKVNAIKP